MIPRNEKDPNHWLFRLTAPEWLAAAETELDHAQAAFDRRAVRQGVTHARRAVGMAWNAVLVMEPDDRYGRSYMDHLVALADDAEAPADIHTAAGLLRDTPTVAPALVTIGKPPTVAVDAARALVAYARHRTAALEQRSSD